MSPSTVDASCSSPATVAAECYATSSLNPHDFVCGRGDLAVTNPGNIRFRALVQHQQKEYRETKRRLRKDGIARAIIRTIQDRGGHFMERVELVVVGKRQKDTESAAYSRNAAKGASSSSSPKWRVADDETVLLKVKQALRGKRQAMSGQVESNRMGGPSAEVSAAPAPELSHHGTDQEAGRSDEGLDRRDESLFETLRNPLQFANKPQTLETLRNVQDLVPRNVQYLVPRNVQDLVLLRPWPLYYRLLPLQVLPPRREPMSTQIETLRLLAQNGGLPPAAPENLTTYFREQPTYRFYGLR